MSRENVNKQHITQLSTGWSQAGIAQDFDGKDRTKDVLGDESSTFDELLLSEPVLSGLRKSNFFHPSPIQLKSIPLGRCGLDLVVQAKSGTGKTCVIGVTALEGIDTSSTALQVIVLAPTREIALQNHAVISSIGQDLIKSSNLRCEVFIGGTSVAADRLHAKNCQIAVGSPGRIKQLIELGVLLTGNVRIFILDEADKLVEEGGMQQQINWIFSTLPVTKQVLALSATYPEVLAKFLTLYMNQPSFVRLNPNDPSLLGLKQYYIAIEDHNLPHLIFEEKTQVIMNLFKNMSFQQALVFSNYHSKAESMSKALNAAGWPCTYISGNMDQMRRTVAITQLKSFKCRILISTDLTARGIDAHNVDIVINMDVPRDWETYMHRIGRAGRFGARGVAISLVCNGSEYKSLLDIAASCNATLLPYPGHNQCNETYSYSNAPIKSTSNHSQSSNQSPPSSSYTPLTASSSDETVPSTVSELSLQRPPSPTTHNDLETSRLQTNSERDVPSPMKSVTFADMNDDSGSSSSSAGQANKTPVKIPNLHDLNSNYDKLRKNTHYLHMNHLELMSDFEHYMKTGKFLEPPRTASRECVTSEFSQMSLSTPDTSSVKLDQPDCSYRDYSNKTVFIGRSKNTCVQQDTADSTSTGESSSTQSLEQAISSKFSNFISNPTSAASISDSSTSSNDSTLALGSNVPQFGNSIDRVVVGNPRKIEESSNSGLKHDSQQNAEPSDKVTISESSSNSYKLNIGQPACAAINMVLPNGPSTVPDKVSFRSKPLSLPSMISPSPNQQNTTLLNGESNTSNNPNELLSTAAEYEETISYGGTSNSDQLSPAKPKHDYSPKHPYGRFEEINPGMELPQHAYSPKHPYGRFEEVVQQTYIESFDDTLHSVVYDRDADTGDHDSEDDDSEEGESDSSTESCDDDDEGSSSEDSNDESYPMFPNVPPFPHPTPEMERYHALQHQEKQFAQYLHDYVLNHARVMLHGGFHD